MDGKELTKAIHQTAVNEKRLPLWARWIITSLLILLVVFLVFVLLKPLRTYSAKKYVKTGDEYLASKKYLHADLAYQKALILSPKNKDVLAKKAMAKEASLDVMKLQTLYQDPKFDQPKKDFESATAFPENETSALKLSRELIEEKEYQLAAIPAKTATEMDPGYRDAWLYLGIASLKTAQLVELAPDVKEKYMQQAKDALLRAKEIDPESKAVADYLKILNI